MMLNNTQTLLIITLNILTRNIFFLSIVPSALLTLGPGRIGMLGENHYSYLGKNERMLSVASVSFIIYFITGLLTANK